MLRRITFPFALTLAFIVAGCGGSSSTSPPTAPLSVSARTPSGLTVTMTEDTSVVAAGKSVTYTMRITNDTAQPITFQEQTGCFTAAEGAGLTVVNAAGYPVYPDPMGTMCGLIGETLPLTLEPGQSTASAVPAIALPTAGRYFATAKFSVGTITEAGLPLTTVGPLAVEAR